jgi:hypothetical protein
MCLLESAVVQPSKLHDPSSMALPDAYGGPGYRVNDKLDSARVRSRQMPGVEEAIEMSKAKDEYEFVELNRTGEESYRHSL